MDDLLDDILAELEDLETRVTNTRDLVRHLRIELAHQERWHGADR